MSNTTDIMITCFDEDKVVDNISKVTGVDFRKVSDGEVCGGPKILSLTSYGACYRSLGPDKITELIAEFKAADFLFPELASLTIDDDNEVFNGVVIREQRSHETSDRVATQVFTLSNILIKHCGEQLSPDNIDFIVAEIRSEITKGSCSWAFNPTTEV